MIKVIRSGLYTILQDTGRFGYRNKGIPVSGAMDVESAVLANRFVGNDDNEVVLEITMLGPTLYFEKEAMICLTGAMFEPVLNGEEVAMNETVNIKKGSTLKLGSATIGMRGYMAVQGGFDAEKVLGSYSHYHGVTKQFRLQKGDELSIKQSRINVINISEERINERRFSEIYLTVTKGPEFDTLSEIEKEHLLQFKGTIDPQSNRMACLLGVILNLCPKEIITSAVQPGTVQVTPHGQCIALMRDAQTTGGYARLLQLTPESINLLSQKRPSESVRFRLVVE